MALPTASCPALVRVGSITYRDGIPVRVVQKGESVRASIVESTVWYESCGGTWISEDGGAQTTFTPGGSGTSGTLRFKTSDRDDYFLVALGVDDSQLWCDVVVDLGSSDTALKVHPTYYKGGERADIPAEHETLKEKRSRQLTNVKVEYYSTHDSKPGSGYQATITIS